MDHAVRAADAHRASRGPERASRLDPSPQNQRNPPKTKLMDAQAIPLKTTGRRFVRTVRNFAQSEVGWKAKLIFAALVLAPCGERAQRRQQLRRPKFHDRDRRSRHVRLRPAGFYLCRRLRRLDPCRGDRSLRRGAARPSVARHDDARDRAPLPRRRKLSTPQGFGSGRQSGPAHLRRRSRLHGHDAFLHADGAQQRLHDRRLLRGSVDHQPAAVRRRRALRGGRLALHVSCSGAR